MILEPNSLVSASRTGYLLSWSPENKAGLVCLRFIIRLVFKLKKVHYLPFFILVKLLKPCRSCLECLDRKIRQMVSVTKLFAFVEIEYFVLGLQVVFTRQMKKSIFVMDWFDAKLHKNELPCFTKDGVVLCWVCRVSWDCCMCCTLQIDFRYQA